MDRDELIRAHFDAFTDLLWATNLEPKFKAAHWDAGEMKEFREAWKGHTEIRDWDWWLEKVKDIPNTELLRDIAECHAQIDTFRKGTETDRERFQHIMAGKDEKQPVQQATKDRGREI